MSDSPFIVGFSGKPGSAKNHFSFKLSQELRFQNYSVYKGSLASQLYTEVGDVIDSYRTIQNMNEVIRILNIPKKYEAELEELVTGDVGEKDPEWGYSRRNENVRKLLGLLGGRIRREQDEDYLLKRMLATAPKTDFILFTDLRYPNEADFLQGNGAAIRCEVNDHWVKSTTTENDGFKYSKEGMNDPTETALDNYDKWFQKVMYGKTRPITFAHSLMRAHGFKVNKSEFFTVQPQ